MSEWIEHRLGDCVDVLDNLRVPVSGELRSAEPGATPYYGANGLQGYINGYIFDEPLILIAEDGGYFDEFAERPIAYRIEGKSWVNNHAHVLRPKSGFDFDFLFYSLQHKDIVAFIKGGTRAKLNQAELRDIKVTAPKDKPTQRKIASILSTIDTAIEQTEALIEKYQHIKAGLMHDLFTRGVLGSGQLRPPREQAPEVYQETAIGWIPKEWDDVLLGQIASFQRGHDIVEANFEEGSFPVVSSSGVIGYHSVATTKAPNVVIGRKGTIGKVHFLEADFWAHDTSLFTTDFFNNDPRFVFHLCIRLELSRFGTKSGSPSLNRNDIHPIRVGRSPKEEQITIAKLMDIATTNLDAERRKIVALKNQKLGLMQNLLTGKVAVTVDAQHREHA